MKGLPWAFLLLVALFGPLQAADLRSDLLFTSSAHGKSDLFLLPAGETQWRRLTDDPVGANWGVWSPDGSRIAFQSRRNGKLDIYLMNADGSGERRLTDHPDHDYLPAWTPDGKRIVFVSWRLRDLEASPPHLFIVNADGSELQPLLEDGLGTSAAASWAPDGSGYLVSIAEGEAGANIHFVPADGGERRQLTEGNDYKGGAVYSPDGRRIAYYRSREDGAQLETMTSAGEDRRIVVADGYNWSPRFSPDGQWLLFTRRADSGDEQDLDLYRVLLDGGGEPEPLIVIPGRQSEAALRP